MPMETRLNSKQPFRQHAGASEHRRAYPSVVHPEVALQQSPCRLVYIYIWMDGWMHACMHACMNEAMSVGKYAGMHVCIYAHR